MSNRTYGAMPPPGLAWQLGKTAATISFVFEADGLLKNQDSVISKEQRMSLVLFVNRLKVGADSLYDFISVSDWLSSQK